MSRNTPSAPSRPTSPSLHGDRLPDHPNFSVLVAAARDEIRTATDVDRLVEVLVAIRTLDVETDARLRLVIARSVERAGDTTLDTKEAAKVIGRSMDWINHHRNELRSALVSPPGTRPRYSKRRLLELLELWRKEGR